MNHANIEKSDRLQRVLELLKRGCEKSTMEIIMQANVMAVSAVVSELRANGYDISCRRDGDLWYYKLQGGQQ